MAIIKTLLLQDLLRLGGRRLLLWTVLLVCGCIQYTLAATPATDVVISVTAGTTGSEIAGTGTKIHRVVKDTGTVELTCAAQNAIGTLGIRFLKNGKEYDNISWQDAKTRDISNFAAANAGIYSCQAKGDDGVATNSTEDTATLTLDCAGGHSGHCVENSRTYAECDGTNHYCKCKVDAFLFPDCLACLPDNTGCAGTTPRCNDANHAAPECAACNATTCKADSNTPFCNIAGTAGACLGCKNTTTGADKGCKPDSASPRCNGGPCAACNVPTPVTGITGDAFCRKVNDKKPKCDTSTGACKKDGTTAATPASGGTTNKANTGDSNGTTGKGSDTTSSAGTVTSTACLVIASVVVALMN